MGYSNDQFYNLENLTDEREGDAFSERSLHRRRKNYFHSDADNPRFIYPDRVVRTWEKDTTPRETDAGRRHIGGNDFFRMEETLLKRGFIRAIARGAGDSSPKCQFQFNPQNITSTVSMSEGLLNFYQQDPGQFAQPLAGNTNMSFTLMFDRTMEINNASSVGVRNSDLQGRYVDPENPWESGSPTQVGVLRDIAALYRVIGQGVSGNDQDDRGDEIRSAIKSEGIGTENLDQGEYDSALANVEKLMEMNVGNYGLLIPRPVRLVFSSLYMVEGYCTSSTVTFTKFNTSFVPIQAMVELTVNAQHVGFAKRDTFTTHSIREAELAQVQFAADAAAANAAVITNRYGPAQDELTNWLLTIQNLDTPAANAGAPPTAGVPSDWAPGQSQGSRLLMGIPSGNFDAVKELMALDGGASVTINAYASFYAYMPTASPPEAGTQGAAHVFTIRTPVATASTAGELDSWESDSPYETLASFWKAEHLMPSGDYGGHMRVKWTTQVRLVHDGVTMVGRHSSVDDFQGEDAFDNHAMQKTVNLHWISDGEATTLLDDIAASPNATGPVPSDVGNGDTTDDAPDRPTVGGGNRFQ